MTREEFINKWSTEPEDCKGMEFDLISVINSAENEKLEKSLREIEERYEKEEPEKKAYSMSLEETKKYIKSISFGYMRGA